MTDQWPSWYKDKEVARAHSWTQAERDEHEKRHAAVAARRGKVNVAEDAILNSTLVAQDK